MKLVIEISEDIFFDLKRKQNRTEVDNAILNSKPLHKGHGRIVDENKITSFGWNNIDNHAVVDAPTIIEADKESAE